MGWLSKGFQVRKNKEVEKSPPKTRRPRKTFILERIITPSALVPGGVDDHDALLQLPPSPMATCRQLLTLTPWGYINH
jgi:hypothetical protein